MKPEGPIHILLVEDSPTDALLAQDALEGRGQFLVAVAQRLAEAMERLKERRFDVVLLDLGLPDSQGLGTISRLLTSNPDVPIVVMTSREDEELGLEAVRAGAQDYLVKGEARDGALSRAIRYAIERKHAEDALRKAHDELELRVRERTVELTRALEVKDFFLASMSHELRTPLNAIIGFTGILRMKLSGPLNADQEKHLETVQTSAKHLLSLITNLLDLTKLESGEVQVSSEPVVCQQVVREILASLRPEAEAKGLQLEAALPEQDMVIQTDRRALAQILLNLTSNALKFTDRGHVRIDVARRRDQEGSVAFSVTDTGIGIRPEDQEHLFQAFRKVGDASGGRHQGTGLGLHLSQKLAVLLGGQVCVQSESGKGSTFTLTL